MEKNPAWVGSCNDAYEDEVKNNSESDEPSSMYQIFKRQALEMAIFIERIDNAVM
jgi:hypothetical protein